MDSQEAMEQPSTPDSESLQAPGAPEPPLLRIWGYFQDKSPPLTKLFAEKENPRLRGSATYHTQYHVKLSHHDSKDGQADLSHPRWFDGLPAMDQSELDLTRQKVAQNLPIRQDRFVEWDHWEPISDTVYIEVEHDHWVPVQLILYDRQRSKTQRDIRQPPTTLLAQHVSSYLMERSRSSPTRKSELEASLLSSESAEAQKSRAPQFSTAVKGNGNLNEKLSTPKPSEQSVHDTISQVRGRVKRRLRRGRLNGRNHAESAVRGSDTIRPDGGVKDDQPCNASLDESRSAIEYLKERDIPAYLLESPQIVAVESAQSLFPEPDRIVGYHPGDEAIIIPIKDPTCHSVMGSLLIAKEAFQTQKPKGSWDSSMMDDATISLTKLDISVKSNLVGTPSSIEECYWRKFPIRASELYEAELRLIEYDDESHMAFSIHWSYQCPALFSPDLSPGLYATEEEYCRESFLVSPHAFYSRVPSLLGGHADDSLRWLSDTSQTWNDQRIEWQDLKVQSFTAPVDDAMGTESLTPVPMPFWSPEESHSTLNKVDSYFSRAIGMLEFQESKYGDRLKDLTEEERFMRSLRERRQSSSRSSPTIEQGGPDGTQKPPDTPDDLRESLSMADFSQESLSDAGFDFFLDDTDADDSQSIDEFEKDLKRLLIFVNTSYSNSREIFYGTRYFGLVPWWTKQNHAKNVFKTMNDPKHHPGLRAHAMLQYSLCLFSGFGVDQDAKKGLEWFWQAAVAGSRRARAVVRRLFRSYGEEVPDEPSQLDWLSKEAGANSQWALDELQHEDHSAYKTELRKQAFEFLKTYQTKDPKDLEQILMEVKPEIQDRLSKLEDQQEQVSKASQVEQFLESGGLEWATCYANATVVSTLLPFYMDSTSRPDHWTANDKIHEFLIAALAAGNTEIAHIFLDQMLNNNERRKFGHNPLFALQHVPDVEVADIISKLVRLGEDVNEQVEDISSLSRDEFFDLEKGRNRETHWHFRREGFSVTPLRWAIENHRPAVVKALLDHGAAFPRVPDAETYVRLHPEGFDPENATVPVLESPCYDLEILKMFLGRHGAVSDTTVFSEAPLGLIATEPDGPERRLRIGQLGRRENLFAVLDLLRTHHSGSDPELFHASVANGHLEIVEYLLLRGVDIELRHRGLTPLQTAVLHGHRAIFDRLLDHGADLCATTTRKGISAAHLVFWKPKAAGTEIYMLSELSRRGVDVLARDTPFGKKVRPFHLAVIGARIAAVDFLLKHGADRAMPLGEEGIMPSLAGARFTDWGIERSERVESHYVGIEDHGRVAVPLKGLTALGILIERWDMYTPGDFVRLLGMLCSDGDGEIRHFYTRPDVSQTALHLVSCYPTLVRAGVLEYILEKGGSAGLHVDIVDCDGDTPLHYASVLGGEGRERLVSLGADPSIRNAHGMTPADLRFWNHLYRIENEPEGSVPKGLKFKSLSSPCADEGDETSVPSMPAEYGTPTARLWDRLEKGVVFREVWDVEKGEQLTLVDDVGLTLSRGERQMKNDNQTDTDPYQLLLFLAGAS